MATTRNCPAEPAVLQRSISETLWDIRKATAKCDQLAALRAEREMNALLDQLADRLITDYAGQEATWSPGPAGPREGANG